MFVLLFILNIDNSNPNRNSLDYERKGYTAPPPMPNQYLNNLMNKLYIYSIKSIIVLLLMKIILLLPNLNLLLNLNLFQTRHHL